MFTSVESLLGTFSREHLFGTTVMCTALSPDGVLKHMSPAFAKVLKGPEGRAADCVGANLANVLGERYGGERVRFVRHTFQAHHPIILRSVVRGRQ